MSNVAAKQDLRTDELHILQSEMDNKKKSPVVAWLLWVFLGSIGAHNFYLGRVGSGIGYILLLVLGWLTIWLLIGSIFFIALGIWWIVDAITMTSKLEKYNGNIEQSVIQDILQNRK